MGIIEDAVEKLEETIRDTGCDDGAVTLRRNPSAVNCQYERGVCIESCYGGRTGEFVTQDPVEAVTKISFMFGIPLPSPQARGAACAVLNVLASFLCLARGVRACPPGAHTACLAEVKELLTGKRVLILGDILFLERELGAMVVQTPDQADVILINNEGLIAPETSELFSTGQDRRKIICIGPSPAGLAALEQIRRFCPYGT